MLKRADIVDRVNQKLYEGMYNYTDIKEEFDDAIIYINNTLHSKFPMFSEVMVDDQSTYSYEDKDGLKAPYFPEKYMRTVVIEYVVAQLFRREAEFSNEYTTAMQAFERNLDAMFRDFYEHVPEEFIDESTGMIIVNPEEVIDDE